jgi:hypothetical protein
MQASSELLRTPADLRTSSTEQSYAWEIDCRLVGQDIYGSLCNTKGYHVQKGRSLDLILSQINPCSAQLVFSSQRKHVYIWDYHAVCVYMRQLTI